MVDSTEHARFENIESLPLIRFEHVWVERNGKILLEEINWDIHSNENWVVIGKNGAGKSLLTTLLRGKLPCSRGEVIYSDELIRTRIAQVSFEVQTRLIAYEQDHEWIREFGTNQEKGTTVYRLLDIDPEDKRNLICQAEIMKLMNIRHLLDSSILTLSNGEMKKVLIAKALLSSPEILILDEPYDGLDSVSRQHLADIIQKVILTGTHIILITYYVDEIPAGITHCLCLENGKIAAKGNKATILKDSSLIGIMTSLKTKPESKDKHRPTIKETTKSKHQDIETTIVMNDVSVFYGDKIVLDKLNWVAKRDENWAIVGPNGAGKTTLLRLISADHPQAYSNEIYLFARKRGSSESIWDIKQKIGMLSPELQIAYRKNLKAIDVVRSGFFDSIGLYRYTTLEQDERARSWLRDLGIEELAETSFNMLSYGQKRLVLLARALVKNPLMLIMDEPCQGLDPDNSRHLINLIDTIAKNTGTQVLFVTHRRDEIPSCITHVLEFKKRSGENEQEDRYITHTGRIEDSVKNI